MMRLGFSTPNFSKKTAGQQASVWYAGGDMTDLVSAANEHATAIVRLALEHTPERQALVVFDERSALSRLLTSAYRHALPNARCIDFDTSSPEKIMEEIRRLQPRDLAVLIQSSNFQLAEYRVRIELFQRSIAVIEHVHMDRMRDDAQIARYVDSLAYNPSFYRPLGHTLKARLDAAERIVVRSVGGAELIYEGGLEPAKLNVGDYVGMKNVGGTFPIGEVFTEPRDFDRVNGDVMLFAFAGQDHLVRLVGPFRVRIERGIVVEHDGPAEFQQVIEQISADEKPLVREFGLGLNPAFGKAKLVDDITAFERQRGMHLSLGEKHNVYRKPGIIPKKSHFHIDVFVDVESIELDGLPLGFP